jgi:hypothetical protein
MVIRVVSVSDRTDLRNFRDVLRAILGWNGDLDYPSFTSTGQSSTVFAAVLVIFLRSTCRLRALGVTSIARQLGDGNPLLQAPHRALLELTCKSPTIA